MELGFLGNAKIPQKPPENAMAVSSGNSKSEKLQEVQKTNTVSDIKYDKSKGNLDQKPRTKDTERVLRLKSFAKDNGFEIVSTLKEALVGRANGKFVCTLRESDIILRSHGHFGNPFLKKVLNDFGAFLCEDTMTLDEGVFELRSAYNKGIEWKRLKRQLCTPEKQQQGDQRLEDIKLKLQIKGLGLLGVEEDVGFDVELLKPEYMDWSQFEVAIQRAKKFKSLATKEREKSGEAETS